MMYSPDHLPQEQKEQAEIAIETFDGRDIPSHVRSAVREFIRDEGQSLEDGRGAAAVNHSLYLLRAIDSASKDERNTFLVVAREQEKIVGAGSLVVQPKADIPQQVELLYFGRAYDQAKKGVGSKILLAEHEILKKLGIKFYTTRVHEDSMKVYRQLGIKHQITPGSEANDTWEVVVKVGE